MPEKAAPIGPIVPISHIAILDDDPDQLLALSKWLGEADFKTSTYDRGATFLKSLPDAGIDAAIIDWGLPDMSGVDVIQKMRDELRLDIPILLITSRNAEQDIIEGLEAGADDYLVKPARHLECVARVEATLRRANSLRLEKSRKDKPVFFGAYHFDVGAREVSFGPKKVLLTEKELQLILLLFSEMGNIVARNAIWSSVWGIVSNQVSSRTIDTHIYRLRIKLELDGQHEYLLKTVHGKGYRLSMVTAGD